jgi:hypothetical protein
MKKKKTLGWITVKCDSDLQNELKKENLNLDERKKSQLESKLDFNIWRKLEFPS